MLFASRSQQDVPPPAAVALAPRDWTLSVQPASKTPNTKHQTPKTPNSPTPLMKPLSLCFFVFFLRTENLATQTDRDAGPHKRLPQSKARKRKGTAKPQWAGAMRGRNSQRLPRRAAPAAGSRRVRHLVAERVRGSGCARPSECPGSSPRSLHVHVHVRSRGRANEWLCEQPSGARAPRGGVSRSRRISL